MADDWCSGTICLQSRSLMTSDGTLFLRSEVLPPDQDKSRKHISHEAQQEDPCGSCISCEHTLTQNRSSSAEPSVKQECSESRFSPIFKSSSSI
ncbi:hypothetical protein RRG08_063188 [Elysia crispata]|uniref:Uncharacterized protein n=1 Tax=Elysia crispata TaxID=231223 RepID=A0AAE0YUF4_9GAST|nr:hypothetical protein RRG08_063188 [Elysia crispata]